MYNKKDKAIYKIEENAKGNLAMIQRLINTPLSRDYANKIIRSIHKLTRMSATLRSRVDRLELDIQTKDRELQYYKKTY